MREQRHFFLSLPRCSRSRGRLVRPPSTSPPTSPIAASSVTWRAERPPSPCSRSSPATASLCSSSVHHHGYHSSDGKMAIHMICDELQLRRALIRICDEAGGVVRAQVAEEDRPRLGEVHQIEFGMVTFPIYAGVVAGGAVAFALQWDGGSHARVARIHHHPCPGDIPHARLPGEALPYTA